MRFHLPATPQHCKCQLLNKRSNLENLVRVVDLARTAKGSFFGGSSVHTKSTTTTPGLLGVSPLFVIVTLKLTLSFPIIGEEGLAARLLNPNLAGVLNSRDIAFWLPSAQLSVKLL